MRTPSREAEASKRAKHPPWVVAGSLGVRERRLGVVAAGELAS